MTTSIVLRVRVRRVVKRQEEQELASHLVMMIEQGDKIQAPRVKAIESFSFLTVCILSRNGCATDTLERGRVLHSLRGRYEIPSLAGTGSEPVKKA